MRKAVPRRELEAELSPAGVRDCGGPGSASPRGEETAEPPVGCNCRDGRFWRFSAPAPHPCPNQYSKFHRLGRKLHFLAAFASQASPRLAWPRTRASLAPKSEAWVLEEQSKGLSWKAGGKIDQKESMKERILAGLGRPREAGQLL